MFGKDLHRDSSFKVRASISSARYRRIHIRFFELHRGSPDVEGLNHSFPANYSHELRVEYVEDGDALDTGTKHKVM